MPSVFISSEVVTTEPAKCCHLTNGSKAQLHVLKHILFMEGLKKDQQLPRAGSGGGGEVIPKGHYEGVFWDNESVLNLDCSGGSMTLYSCQNSLNGNPKQ